MNYDVYVWSEQNNDTHIDDLPISARLRKALKRIEVTTLSEMRILDDETLKAKRFTKTEVKELKELLQEM